MRTIAERFGVIFVGALFVMGILFPVFATILVVRRWTRVSVTDALQHFGVNPVDEGGSIIDRLPLPISINLRMGLRNAFRKPQRMVLTVATLAVGLLIFMVAMNVRSSLVHTAEMEESLKRFDVKVLFEGPIANKRVAWMDHFGIVERAETWRLAPAMVIDENGLPSGALPIYMVPDGSRVMQPNMMDGDWISPAQPAGVVINHRLQNKFPLVTVGSTMKIRIGGEILLLPVVGVLKEFGGAAIYMRDADYQLLVPTADDRINAAFIALR